MSNLSHKQLTQDDIDMYFYYRKNGLNKGFYDRYFSLLKTARTTVEAFNAANDEYFELFGEYKYSSIYSFRKTLKRYLDN